MREDERAEARPEGSATPSAAETAASGFDPSDERLREFLAQMLELPLDALPRANRWVRSGNSIGAIALRLGLMSLDDVEQVVDLQAAADSRRFGELGCLLGMIEDCDVRRLLELQQAHRALDELGALLLRGELELSDLLRSLAAYFEQADEAES